jgi:O-antigen/teichoic acid export membrane protein
MSIASMLFTIILTPYWSSVTEAYAKGELDWIKKSMKNLIKFSAGILILILILVIAAPYAYDLWIGDVVSIPFSLTLGMAVFFSVMLLYAPFNVFINGIGKIRLHMYSFALGAILNIPLSIILVKYTFLGVEGVIVATIICILPNLLLFPMQYYKLINKTAKGIWNK